MAATRSPRTTGKARARNVTLPVLAGAIVTIAVYIFNTYILPAGKPLDSTVSAALTTLVTFLLTCIVRD